MTFSDHSNYLKNSGKSSLTPPPPPLSSGSATGSDSRGVCRVTENTWITSTALIMVCRNLSVGKERNGSVVSRGQINLGKDAVSNNNSLCCPLLFHSRQFHNRNQQKQKNNTHLEPHTRHVMVLSQRHPHRDIGSGEIELEGVSECFVEDLDPVHVVLNGNGRGPITGFKIEAHAVSAVRYRACDPGAIRGR